MPVKTSAAVRLLEDELEIVIDGLHYLDVLSQLHRRLRPRTYFEIGTWKGASLRVAKCSSLAIDTEFRLDGDVVGTKPLCVLYQTTSDAFFASHEARDVLGGPVDLAFIDAFHIFENVLREFIGTERSCTESSVILLDDCCPRDMYMTRRTLRPERPQVTKYDGYWTGDVWKIAPILRKYRPDIRVELLDTQPTGLLACTNLNPNDSILTQRYEEIVQQWRDTTLERYGMGRLLDDLRPTPSTSWLTEVQPLHPDDPEPVEAGPAEPSQDETIRALSRELAGVYSSRSWSLTKPLRELGGMLRGLRRD